MKFYCSFSFSFHKYIHLGLTSSTYYSYQHTMFYAISDKVKDSVKDLKVPEYVTVF